MILNEYPTRKRTTYSTIAGPPASNSCHRDIEDKVILAHLPSCWLVQQHKRPLEEDYMPCGAKVGENGVDYAEGERSVLTSYVIVRPLYSR